MVDPSQHHQSRGWIESILRYVPGFSGYLNREYRREADQLARTWMADELATAQTALDSAGQAFIAQGNLDALDPIGRLKTSLDRLSAGLRGAVQGYSAFFDYVQIRTDQLDAVYEQDMKLLEAVRRFRERTETLARTPETTALPGLIDDAGRLQAMLTERSRMLQGLGETGTKGG